METSEQIAHAMNDVILAWALFAGVCFVVFGAIWLVIYKPWKKDASTRR